MRRIAAQIFFVAVVVTQLYFVVRGYWDPHKHFAFQPFNESSTWRAEIVRVLPDGRRVSIRHGWHGYRWEELVRERGLGAPWHMQHADSGVGSTVDFLQRALDWVADHTPRDRETVRFEAVVTYNLNRRGEVDTHLRSRDREEARRP
jgi:hypothetical protein